LSGKKVGIGTAAPQRILQVEGTSRFSFTSSNCMVEVLNWNLAGGPNDICFNATNIANSAHAAMVFAGSKFYFYTGNVGIGTADTKGYKLAVAGSMIAEEVVVKLQSAWPDYVFSPNYQLMSLNKLEKFVQVNKHLPGIPTAKEINQEGINLSEINAKLLQKVEELTIYLIDQNKKIEALEAENELSKSKLD